MNQTMTLRITLCEYSELCQCLGFVDGVLMGEEWKDNVDPMAIGEARQKLERVRELLGQLAMLETA